MTQRRKAAPFPALGDRWQAFDAGVRYSSRRWRSARAAERDLLLVRRILRQHGVEPSRGGVLDAPCGTGRLRPVLEQSGGYVGVDVSDSMLRVAAQAGGARLVRASIDRLPFQDETFDVVVACRILHHAREADELERYARELVRVSARLVVASFWDAASLPAWRVRVGLRRPGGRHAITKEDLREVFHDCGAEVVGFYHTFRFVSQQAFLVAHKKARAKSPAPRRTAASVLLPAAAPYGAEGALGGA